MDSIQKAKEYIKVMQAFVEGKEIEFKNVDGSWSTLGEPTWSFYNVEYRVKPEEPIIACIVYGCSNKSNEGRFVGDICLSCHDFIISGNGRNSTLARNGAKAFLKD